MITPGGRPVGLVALMVIRERSMANVLLMYKGNYLLVLTTSVKALYLEYICG